MNIIQLWKFVLLLMCECLLYICCPPPTDTCMHDLAHTCMTSHMHDLLTHVLIASRLATQIHGNVPLNDDPGTSAASSPPHHSAGTPPATYDVCLACIGWRIYPRREGNHQHWSGHWWLWQKRHRSTAGKCRCGHHPDPRPAVSSGCQGGMNLQASSSPRAHADSDGAVSGSSGSSAAEAAVSAAAALAISESMMSHRAVHCS